MTRRAAPVDKFGCLQPPEKMLKPREIPILVLCWHNPTAHLAHPPPCLEVTRRIVRTL